jgi:hypothetical protein
MELILVFVGALQESPTPELPGASSVLRYLIRHQNPDGSWGSRPEGCTCPDQQPDVLACDFEKVAPFLRAMADEDPGLRNDAEKGLGALGLPALPHLRAASQRDPDAEVRARCRDLVGRLELRAQTSNNIELTALALLVFLDAGYSHLSRDEYEGTTFGRVVKKGLQWLLACQKGTGAFDSKDPVAHCIATFAVSEAYGLTAAAPLQGPSQLGIDHVVAFDPKEPRGLFWKGIALKSAESSEIHFPKAAYESLEAIRSMKGDLAVAGTTVLSIFVYRRKSDPRLGDIRALDPAKLEDETLYAGSLAAFQFDGAEGGFWKFWHGQLKRLLLPAQRLDPGECERGSWDGRSFRSRLRTTALNGLDLEFCPR